MIRPMRVLVLTALWVFMWGSLTVANVSSGIVVSAVLLALFPDHRRATRPSRRYHAPALIRLAAHLAVQLLVSNALVLREVVRRRSRVRPAVVACHLNVPSPSVTTFVANVLALTPGTVPVELRESPPTIVLHVLNLRDPVALRQEVRHLEQLAVEAFGTLDERAALGAATTGTGATS